jgi:hypothetical protein
VNQSAAAVDAGAESLSQAQSACNDEAQAAQGEGQTICAQAVAADQDAGLSCN